jgi:uncharacterized protein YdaT
MSVVEIAYNPNDFYYIASGVYNDIKETQCHDFLNGNVIDDWETTCKNATDKTWKNLASNCFKFEVCKNKNYADLVSNLENNSSGANERNSNLRNQYHNEIIKTINISASILLITYLSVYFFKT